MADGKWKLDESKVKRMEELQRELAALQDDNGELKDLPLENVTNAVINVNGEVIPTELGTDTEAKVVAGTASDEALYKERTANVMDSVSKAFRSGKMLIAVYCVTDGMIRLERHTHGFIPEDFQTSIDLLRKDLLGESTPQLMRPLPRATVKRPETMEVLFGKKTEEETAK